MIKATVEAAKLRVRAIPEKTPTVVRVTNLLTTEKEGAVDDA